MPGTAKRRKSEEEKGKAISPRPKAQKAGPKPPVKAAHTHGKRRVKAVHDSCEDPSCDREQSDEERSADKKPSLCYQCGYNNEFESSSVSGALPRTTTPKKCPFKLYAEQLSGTAFTVPRHIQRRSWLFRKIPACSHQRWFRYKKGKQCFITANFSDATTFSRPDQMRWHPFPFPTEKTDFVDGMKTLGGAGSAEGKNGLAIHIYAANDNMRNRAFVNSDGDFLVVPQKGVLRVQTEFGLLDVCPGEIFIIPRGVRFKVLLQPGTTQIRGYICEIFHGHFEIPDLGPIGSNGLANARDFKAPVAHAEVWEKANTKDTYQIIYKFLGELWYYKQDHTPFDVVAWRGNYTPYKYNLADFVPVNSVLRDHMDPSIFTVLTCQSLSPGVAVADFVIFPPRYAVQEDTFRPPFYHRNCMSEFMGNIRGEYDAREGFRAGSASLHSCMVGHGPDADTFKKATSSEEETDEPKEESLAFMFESTFVIRLTKWALETPRDKDYNKVWDGLEQHYKEKRPRRR